ncbi:acyltransferase [Massilia sp. CFBP9026]|uniref:acyltransferase family protein n=1 Tax=Massilia sp. CFBP9026 TaxID=3096536 RepID=UPI002A6AF269|nr:acyltransferase [Massilia sp. CFBP9026]MDY0960502.1 acyltransferase [Massilia sp. CFBP9026]
MRAAPSPLDQPFSVYLDLVRFLAALAVVAMHMRQFGLVEAPGADLLTLFGREAVMAFFVLSGFVIAYTTEQRRPSARDYALARAARIYSVALPVLLLAFACASLVRGHLMTGMDLHYQLAKPWFYIPFHLLFLGDLWSLAEVPPWLGPWWSLNYEVWYYVLFGVACYVRGPWRLPALGLVLAVMGVKLWLLLPVWLAGVALYHWQARHTLSCALARLGWIASLALLVLYEASGVEETLRTAGRASWLGQAVVLGNADRFLSDYVFGLIVCLNFACARFARFSALLRCAAPIRLLASYTLTLYLSHALVLIAWPALYPHDPGSMADLLALGLAVAVATAVLGMLTEQRKDVFRRLLARLAAAVWRPARLASACAAPAAPAAPIKEKQDEV